MTLAEFRRESADLPGDTPLVWLGLDGSVGEIATCDYRDLDPEDPAMANLTGREIIICEGAS
jgi:hypothetical protein